MHKVSLIGWIVLGVLLAVMGTVGTTKAEETAFTPSSVEAPVFSAEAGFYTDEFLLELTKQEEGEIYYTLDGSTPDVSDSRTKHYEEPILIRDVMAKEGRQLCGIVVRAIFVNSEGVASDDVTKSYFVYNAALYSPKLAVISLSTNRENLYDSNTGLFFNINERGEAWEREVHFEYFDATGKPQVSLNCGVRLHGGASRKAAVKSLRLYARKEYDTQKTFDYDFFSDGCVEATVSSGDNVGKPLVSYKRLLIRNGGNEAACWDKVMFRDTLTQYIAEGIGVDNQAVTPVLVVINGLFYGFENLQERLDTEYLSSHYDCKEKDVAIYEFWYGNDGKQGYGVDVKEGVDAEPHRKFYEEAYEYATTEDLTIKANYDKVSEYFDLDNFIDYYCMQIYGDNYDWPGNNCKAWRYIGETSDQESLDGRIRFLLFDTEYGWTLYGQAIDHDAVERLLQTGVMSWPNQDGSTAMFQNLLRNDSFREAFVTRFLDLMNSYMGKEELLGIIDTWYEDYENGMLMMQTKSESANFAEVVENIRNFVRLRQGYVFEDLNQAFALGDSYELKIRVNANEGEVTVNTLTLGEDKGTVSSTGSEVEGVITFVGTYAKNYGVKVTAEAKDGYRFIGWTGDFTSEANSMILDNTIAGDIELQAMYTKLVTAEPTKIPTRTSNISDVRDVPLTYMILIIIMLGVVIAAITITIVLRVVRKKEAEENKKKDDTGKE